MSLSLRQVAFVARERDPVVDDLRAVLGIDICFVDDAVAEFGLENAVMPVGAQFIEVVAPIRPGTPAARYLDRRGGDTGYMVICQAASAAEQQACRDRAHELGVRVAWEKSHSEGCYLQLHPRDTGGCFFEIDAVNGDDPRGPWPPAGGAGTACDSGARASAITAVEITSHEPEQLCERWRRIAGGGPATSSATGHTLQFANAVARFTRPTDGHVEGLTALALRCNDHVAILRAAAARSLLDDDGVLTIGGVRITLEHACPE
jgi:hypothetical protein